MTSRRKWLTGLDRHGCYGGIICKIWNAAGRPRAKFPCYDPAAGITAERSEWPSTGCCKISRWDPRRSVAWKRLTSRHYARCTLKMGMSRSMLKLGERALRDMEVTRPFGCAQGRDGLEWLSAQPSGSAIASTP